MDTFLAIVSGALEMFLVVTSWGGALWFLLLAEHYVFNGVKGEGDFYLMSMCLGFGLMVFYGLSNIKRSK